MSVQDLRITTVMKMLTVLTLMIYVCQCKTGFFDENTDPAKTGRVCIGLVIDRPQENEKTTLSPNLVPCGNTYCRVDLREVPIVVRVIDFDGEPLQYSIDYSKPNSPEHVQIVDTVVKGLGDVFKQTDVAPRYITTDINYITNPKVENRASMIGGHADFPVG
ncbi:unnamed protein product [Strongylus vulgaris]|uniref:SEA domain-containing protein n=1 Tax=Strongylus vulgaris TaxID=40348 RepID=A0A3P7IPX2_STRVU|nr:unnamed protein product [Strongylus vulgaris]